MSFKSFSLSDYAEDHNVARRAALRSRIRYICSGLQGAGYEEVEQWELAATSEMPEDVISAWIACEQISPATDFLLKMGLNAFTAEAIAWSSRFNGLFDKETQSRAQEKIGSDVLLLDCDFATGNRLEECLSGIRLLGDSLDWETAEIVEPNFELALLAKIIAEKYKRLLSWQQNELHPFLESMAPTLVHFILEADGALSSYSPELQTECFEVAIRILPESEVRFFKPTFELDRDISPSEWSEVGPDNETFSTEWIGNAIWRFAKLGQRPHTQQKLGLERKECEVVLEIEAIERLTEERWRILPIDAQGSILNSLWMQKNLWSMPRPQAALFDVAMAFEISVKARVRKLADELQVNEPTSVQGPALMELIREIRDPHNALGILKGRVEKLKIRPEISESARHDLELYLERILEVKKLRNMLAHGADLDPDLKSIEQISARIDSWLDGKSGIFSCF